MKIGVIGGNGVAATNRLCDMIERKVTAAGAFRDAHHPEMIVWQATSVPSRSMFLEGRGPDWRPDYIRIAAELKRIGCEVGCMCCNTAHYAVDQIEQESELRFINLLEEVAKKCRDSGVRKFELFCSDGARKFDIYGKAFRKIYPKAEILYPSDERQRLVTKVICDVKNKSRFRDKTDEESPFNLLTRLVLESTYPVILGCTDLRVAYGIEEQMSPKVIVDSLETLADSIVTIAR
jgi:aspartate racemase